MTSRRTLVLAVLAGSLLTTSCLKKVAETWSDLVVVRDQIVKKFGEEVEVNVGNFGNQTSLRITFVNSLLNDKSQADRAKRAQETAEIVKLHYPQIGNLKATWVRFVRHESWLGVFNKSDTIDLFAFDRDARPLSNFDDQVGMSLPAIELETKVNYLEPSDESDIAVSGLQLEGVAGAGLTLIPHFTVAGNASEKAAKAPSVVMFDFASYAEREKFSGLVDFKFVVDGQTTVSTQGQFSPYKPPGSTGQFCYLKFPYKAFQRMLSGESLTIQVGEESYELTEEQLEALKEMTRYVKE